MISTRLASRSLAVLRIVACFVLFQHGLQKLFGLLGGAGGAPGQSSWAAGNPMMGTIGILETVGSILVALGLFTRPVAFLLSGEMAFAYFMRHAGKDFWPVINRGEPAVLLCFIFLMIAASGPGAWALDSSRASWPESVDQ
ncbi:MAG: DoxX family protein [Gemmatimonadaceae bacterium]